MSTQADKIRRALKKCENLMAESYAEYNGPPSKHPLNFIDEAIAALSELKAQPAQAGDLEARCDYRSFKCSDKGETINGVWVCYNHIDRARSLAPSPSVEQMVEEIMKIVRKEVNDYCSACVNGNRVPINRVAVLFQIENRLINLLSKP